MPLARFIAPFLFALVASTPPAPASAQPVGRKPCPTGDALFTHLPTDLASVAAIVPLGNLNPPGHTLPTRHIYVYPEMLVPGDPSTAITVPVRAPGLMEIVAVAYHPDAQDWSLYLKPCRDVMLYFFHLNALAPAIAAAVGNMADGVALPDFVAKTVAIPVKPGELLGEAKTFDIGLQDVRKPPQPFVNPQRYAVDFPALYALLPELAGDPAAQALVETIVPRALANRCPIDYFKPGPQAALAAKLGDFDGATPASGNPPCHSHMQDVAFSAQGNWFHALDPTNAALLAEEFAVALANWNVDPAVQLFSLNENVPGFLPQLLEAPADPDDRNAAFEFPVREGPQRTNRRFAEIVDDALYCYDLVRVHRGGPRLEAVILLAVSDGPGGPRSQLTLELVDASRCPALPEPWSFSGNAAIYYR
jgi:hypothetical protein